MRAAGALTQNGGKIKENFINKKLSGNSSVGLRVFTYFLPCKNHLSPADSAEKRRK
jgi:hypothetical protein